jgi:hypothetical protein
MCSREIEETGHERWRSHLSGAARDRVVCSQDGCGGAVARRRLGRTARVSVAGGARNHGSARDRAEVHRPPARRLGHATDLGSQCAHSGSRVQSRPRHRRTMEKNIIWRHTYAALFSRTMIGRRRVPRRQPGRGASRSAAAVAAPWLLAGQARRRHYPPASRNPRKP